MNVLAVGTYVVIRPVAKATTTEGGIILPDAFEAEAPLRGEVESFGEAVTIDIAVDDSVLFDPYGSFDAGDGLVAVAEANIIAVLSEARTDEREALYDEIDDEVASGNYHSDEPEPGCVVVCERERLVKKAAAAIAAIEVYDNF